MLSWITWNPSRVAFTVPFLEHPVVWYGIFFALGFLASYMLGVHLFLYEVFSKTSVKKEMVVDQNRLIELCRKYPKLFDKNQLNIESILPLLHKYIKAKILPLKFFNHAILHARKFATAIIDQLTTYLAIGILIGARLGYVFFYGWPSFKSNPIEIFKIWEGGLASHGASFGILLGLTLFIMRRSKEKLKFTFLHVLDVIAIFTGVIAFFIRIGNFVNQEIVGTPTNVPWAVIFAQPFGGETSVPRHPVQLYEAFFYLFLAALTYMLWKKNKVKMGEGVMSGVLLVLLFSFRFCIEFLKEHQGLVIQPQHALQMGQILSIPFVVLGLTLALRPIWQGKKLYKKSQV
ncbi:MAG: Phosphatidylglycerol--prolipoprotein diacylglyceryl transferase [Chlamydiae bacterium]|nr:Phosphatidylglycerol--prolipoprotein diacylglyceryl transferase [Chlamydiota bacterium]